jgi:hypothetical protein
MTAEKNVLFKDAEGMIYIGEKDDSGEIVGFKNIQITMDLKDISTYNMLKPNEFLVIEIEEEGKSLKVTPITKGELNEGGTTSPIVDIPKDKRLEIFNSVIG